MDGRTCLERAQRLRRKMKAERWGQKNTDGEMGNGKIRPLK
jgi:hypothetical protein